jgi:hypothetical protein
MNIDIIQCQQTITSSDVKLSEACEKILTMALYKHLSVWLRCWLSVSVALCHSAFDGFDACADQNYPVFAQTWFPSSAKRG